MRRKSLKALSLALTATMLLSSAGTGVSVYAAGTDSNVVETSEEQSVSEEVSTTELEEDSSQEEVVTETTTTEQVTSEQTTTEQVTTQIETVQETTTTEQQENVEEQTSEEQTTEEVDEQEEELDTKLEATDSALVSSVITDQTLLNAVLNAYNTGAGKSISANQFTYGLLRAYTGTLDISTATTVTTIPKEAFYGCRFTAIKLPSSIRKIEYGAFKNCTNLTEITLPNELQVLGAESFTGCAALTKINSSTADNTLPAKLTEVGQQAFKETAVKEITIPSFSTGEILTNAASLFANCYYLENITIGSSITTLPMSAFLGAGTSTNGGVSITFESGSKLDKILDGAFKGIKLSGETLDLSNCSRLTAVSNEAFRSVQNLSTVILPKSITSSVTGKAGTLEFGANTFAQTALKEMYTSDTTTTGIVTLPNYVVGVGAGCFYGNTTMTAVSLSPQLPAIPDYTFDGCTSLASVEQRQSGGICQVKEIGDCAFRKTAITNTNFLMNMNQLETIGYQKLTKYGIGSVENTTTIYSIAEGGTDVKVDDTTHEKKSISGNKPCGSEVFTGCTNLTAVTIPASVKTIGSRAFYFAGNSGDDNSKTLSGITSASKSNITTITWASSTSTQAVERRICSEAFHGNVKLEKVILPENTNESLYIEPYAFYEDVALKTVNVKEGGSENTLPKTLKELGTGAFFWCAALKEITIPSTTSGDCPQLGTSVFEKCINLATITFPDKIRVIPERFCYDAPIESFSAGSGTTLTSIGNLAFMGNQIKTLDLSAYSKLAEIGAGAFAYEDGLTKTNYIYTAYNLRVNGQNPAMTTVILPSKLDRLYINSAAFRAQTKLTTMKTPNAGRDGQVYIPDYMPESGMGIFGETAVSKVIWQADTTGTNQWTKIPEMMYHNCTDIINAEDVLPTGSYVTSIGKQAFYASSVQSADLSRYTSLTLLGSGSTPNTQYPGVFQFCGSLKTVTLPEATEYEIGDKTFNGCTALSQITFKNGLKVIGKNAFENCTALTRISFPATLKVVGASAFASCSTLASVDFGSLEEIQNYAFLKCTALVLTNSGLPDTLKTIGSQAFKGDTSLGEVEFGSQLTKIDSNAFDSSGLSKADFTKAINLETIGQGAFYNTQLKNFQLENTKVKTVNRNVLAGCLELLSAEFGDSVTYIDQDALAGCPKFNAITFASTTTVNNRVFYTKVANRVTAEESSSGKGAIAITVETPEETIVPIGRLFDFPFEIAVTPTSGSSPLTFLYALIGNAASSDDVNEYIKLSACLKDGYYKQKNSNDEGKYIVSVGDYYETLNAAHSRTGLSGKKVDTILMSGLKATDKPVEFTLGCSIQFESADTSMSYNTNFAATYHLTIKDVPLYADVYDDKNRTNLVKEGQTTNIQVAKASGAGVPYYYRMNSADASITPDTYNVVVETDNPEVLYPSASNGGKKQSIYTTNATNTYNGAITEKSNGSSSYFWLVPAGVGTANIKVYPQGYPQYARTYTYTVNSDISSIALTVPSPYNGGVKQGDTFNVFSNFKNYFNQTVKVENIANYSAFTNQTLQFISDAPDYATVDNQGNVTILKADTSDKTVSITATATNSTTGKKVTSNKASFRIKGSSTQKDSATGATVTVTKPGSKTSEGEVTYDKTATASNQVTVPSTVTVNGIKYKVTAISDSAFSGNKTITKVTIPASVTKIGKKAFYNCKKLKTVTFSGKSNLVEIGESAFQNCSALTKITIPAKVKKIGKNAFKGCTKLKTVSISSKSQLTEIGSGAFYNCKKITKITIPKKVTKIGSNAFYNCKKLKTITIKSTVLSSVGKNAFKNIYKKATIKVPKSKLSVYQQLLKGKGQKKTVKIKK